jgi:hypothetical protein
MLFVAHQFRSVDKAKEWRDKGALVDSLKQSGEIYYNQGRYAIDILAAGGAAQTIAQAAGVSATGAPTENTSGVNPDDVFTFSGSGTGTRSNFDALSGPFKSAVLKMAQEFKTKTGSKINISSAYRSTADQQALIDRWRAAGGGPNTPTAGGITTPSLKHSAHNDGMGLDSGQMSLVARTVDLAQYGLRWGGTFSKPDVVHIQLTSATLQ